ncbi:helix-turn-helix transcriptional regulator [Solwaraspora sp. WMMD406]|uniref:helix-turn-helix domain-containing protein n=1 Tax=Solwaraspora sp. WMMD406 TaxID=3016095 RepID=UPI0024166053|nr:helix-turn-helix transcriptional regulator [Solwaraspora sp. WMMD406]MDG4765722.1 helix-turn-helix transcriptional regulator [Solwaraspora sp. WMMD406]
MSNNGVPRTLRYLRAANGGLTQEQLAQRLHVSTSLIAKFETGRQIPRPDTAKKIDDLFGSAPLIDETAAEARRTAAPDWFRPLAEVEKEALTLRQFEPNVIPGLLQTEEYARAILRSGTLTPAKADEYLAVRMARQSDVFGQDDPPVCQFIIDENGLRRGDPMILRPQLEHLAEVGTDPRVLIQVAPASAGWHPGQNGQLTLASLRDGSSVGFVDDQLAGRLVTDPELVADLEHAWQAISGVALPCDQSRDLIMKLVKEL